MHMSKFLDFWPYTIRQPEDRIPFGTKHAPSCPSQHETFLHHHAAVHILTLILKSLQKLLHAPKAFITHDELLVVGKRGLKEP